MADIGSVAEMTCDSCKQEVYRIRGDGEKAVCDFCYESPESENVAGKWTRRNQTARYNILDNGRLVIDRNTRKVVHRELPKNARRMKI